MTAPTPAPSPTPTQAQITRTLSLVPVTEDVIEYTIACALALSPPEIRAELRAHIALHASQQARRIFGGDRLYIGLKVGEGNSARNAQIKRDYLAGEHIPLLERRYKLSPAHLWRIIKS
jgi:Mor family transcriptional regulator